VAVQQFQNRVRYQYVLKHLQLHAFDEMDDMLVYKWALAAFN
jgi:hypothetical protein